MVQCVSCPVVVVLWGVLSLVDSVAALVASAAVAFPRVVPAAWTERVLPEESWLLEDED